MGGQVHTRFLSPKVSSILPTLGQSFSSDLTKGAGKAASSLVYGLSQSLEKICCRVCGDLLTGLLSLSISPSSIALEKKRLTKLYQSPYNT